MIAREVIDEIILRNDIESLIGSYVSLKRAGGNLKGLCPFHSEKTPSFTVYPQDNSFYCFGCGIGGNAITFIRQMEHLDYPDAVEFLAKRAGITVIRDDEKHYQKEKINKARLLQMNVDAARYFNRALFANTPKAKAALAYLTEKRRLELATINHFGLGYAPDSFDAFLSYMKQKGYTEDELVIAFLATKSDRGGYFSSFRDRVMFPIIDVSGNVIAFGGRVMNDEQKPKYKNTMDTPVFKKSRNLFALNFAKSACTERLVLCEGYMDVIAMHAAGITNAVATLGTAITPEQARLMSRYTKQVVICYDSDEAGQKATEKALKLLGEVGLEVTVLKVSGAKDPDEYIKTYGKDKFSELIGNSKSKFEYNLDRIIQRFDLSLPQDKIYALAEIEKMISSIYSRAERDVYIRTVAEKFEVDPKSIKADIERLVQRREREATKAEGQKLHQQTAGYGDRVNPDYARAPEVARKEETVLGLLLLYPEHRENVFKNNLLTVEDFYTNFGKRVFEFLKNAHLQNLQNPDGYDEFFTPDEVGRITKMKIERMRLDDNSDAILAESIDSLKASMQKKNAETILSFDDLANLINNLKPKSDS